MMCAKDNTEIETKPEAMLWLLQTLWYPMKSYSKMDNLGNR